MAWITPVTDRADGTTLLTPADMDRITGDVAFLQEEYNGVATISQTSWRNEDILTATFWHEMLTAITSLLTAIGITGETMTDDLTYSNLNNIETNLLRLYGQTADVTDFTAYGDTLTEDGGDVDINDYTVLESTTVGALEEITGG